MFVAVLLWTSASADVVDINDVNVRGGRLVGQIISCGGHPRLAEVRRRLRDAIAGPEVLSLMAAYQRAKDQGFTDQRKGLSGMTCLEVMTAFERLAVELK